MDNTKTEYIICSAIWCRDLKLKNTDILSDRGNLPYNIETGIVFSGYRHHNVIAQICAMTNKRMCDIGYYQQGFLTSQNRFLNRCDAAELALNVEQIDSLKFSRSELFSEDLY